MLARGPGEPAVLIDMPPDVDGIAALVAAHDLIPVAALATHAHIDHWGGAGGVADRWTLTTYLHPDDDWMAADPEAQIRALFGMPIPGDFRPPDTYSDLADGQVLDIAGFAVEVLHTPGHTPGHCCFHVPDEGLLFSGDQLFAGSIGRSDLPGGDYDTLMRSMGDKIVPLPAETDVLPGHGPVTTLAAELATNPFLEDFRP
ncbi:MAG: MBL fold metallo-hydrolase [Acidimicrobiia bacterium]|nr:MBL fold metallo-hydrolase [Acidimicrobiia bacterium]